MKCLITSARYREGEDILYKYRILNKYQPSIVATLIYSHIQGVVVVETNDLGQLVDDIGEKVLITSRKDKMFEYEDFAEKHNVKYCLMIYDDHIE